MVIEDYYENTRGLRNTPKQLTMQRITRLNLQKVSAKE